MKNKSKEKTLPPPPVWKIPTPAVALLFVGWSLLVLVLYFQNFPISLDSLGVVTDQLAASHLFNPYILKCLGALAMAIWLSWLALRSGTLLLEQLIPAAGLLPLEVASFGFALGYGFLSYLTLGLSLVGLWYAVVFWAILGALTLFFLVKRPTHAISATPGSALSGPWNSVWIILLAAFLLLLLWGELTPEIFYDSLHYHLAVPNLYRLHHRLIPLPTLFHSNFVMMIQMVYGLANTLNNEITAKLIHGALAVFLVVGFFSFGQRYLSRGAGMMASLLFLSMPLVVINGMTTGIDVGYSFFQLVAGYALILAFTDAINTRAWLHVAGLLTGLCAACKYTAFSTIPFAVMLIVSYRRWDERVAWKLIIQDVLHFLIPAVLIVAPFLVKNMIFNGNPLYPFGGMHWGSPRIDPLLWQKFTADTSPRDIRATLKSGQELWRLLVHPWFITLNGRSNSDFIGPLYLVFLPLLFLSRKKSTSLILLRRYFLLLWVQWMLVTTAPRYGLAAFTFLALWVSESLLALCASPWLRAYVLGVFVLGACSNLYYQLLTFFNTGGWQVVGGLVSEPDYLGTTHPSYPTPPYDGIVWMNANLSSQAKILFVGDARSHYTQRDVVPSGPYDVQPILQFARNAHTASDMAHAMQDQQITHLFLNYIEAVRIEGYGLFPFDQTSWGVFKDFWSKYVVLIWKSENWDRSNPKALYVYRLLSDQEAAQPHPAPPDPFERWAPK